MGRLPLIGISGSHNAQERQLFVRENYMESVLRAGGLPVLLPHTKDESAARELIGHLDGLLLAGGVDIEPSRYGEQTLPECGEIDLQRDEFEMLIARVALEQRIPIFGICRGIQSLAVAMGGTLYQDIESQLGIEAVRHEQKPPYNVPAHTVCFAPDGLFARILGTNKAETNSMHHQSVKDAGSRLIVEGYSEDGIVEAVRSKENDAVFAVQYHPEYMSGEYSHAAKLFEYLVKCAKDYATQK